jgi:hypothetical protein
MMANYLDLRTSIANDLTRGDLDAQIKKAVLDAVRTHAVSRFWFNVTRRKTFETDAGRAGYGAADLAEIPDLIAIEALYLFDGASRFPLDFWQIDHFEMLSVSPSQGRPTCYTRADGEILLWPTPNAAWTLRPHIHFRFPELVRDEDSSPWTNEAEQLIRAQAKWFLYANVIEDDEGASRMLPQIGDYKARLDAETSRRSASGTIKPVDF